MEPTKRPPQAKPGMTSTELRSVIKQLVNMELKEAQALLDQCTLEKRAALLARIGKMVMPSETPEDEKGGGTTTVIMNLNDDEEPIVKEIAKPGVAKKQGRPMGSPNKSSQHTKEHLEAIFISEYNYVTGRLNELSPDKRLDLLLKLASMVISDQVANQLRKTVVTMNLD